jgi:hypothetical protein
MTVTASSRCASELPEAMRSSRTYTATIAQVGDTLVVTMSKSPLWLDHSFTGVFGEADDVVFQLYFEELVGAGPVSIFFAKGRMTATISDGGLSGFLDGDITGSLPNEEGRGSYSARCTAPDHGVVLSPPPS